MPGVEESPTVTDFANTLAFQFGSVTVFAERSPLVVPTGFALEVSERPTMPTLVRYGVYQLLAHHYPRTRGTLAAGPSIRGATALLQRFRGSFGLYAYLRGTLTQWLPSAVVLLTPELRASALRVSRVLTAR